MATHNLPPPRRITASNLPLTSNGKNEPGVEIITETLDVAPIPGFDGLRKAAVATVSHLPASNDGHGLSALQFPEVPAPGIVMPGGLNIYYLDLAPNSTSAMHRTTSLDYLIVLSGELTLATPGRESYHVQEGRGDYDQGKKVEESTARAGDVVLQRGMMHALCNRGNEWTRLLCVVAASEPNKVPVEGGGDRVQKLEDAWLSN